MSEQLKEWYEGIEQKLVAPNGTIKLKVPVIDAESGQAVKAEEPGQDSTADGGFEGKKESDPVVEKDKHNSLKAFVYAKRMQDLLVRLAGLTEPYEEDSEQRQAIADKIKLMHKKLGEEIACL